MPEHPQSRCTELSFLFIWCLAQSFTFPVQDLWGLLYKFEIISISFPHTKVYTHTLGMCLFPKVHENENFLQKYSGGSVASVVKMKCDFKLID